MSWIISLALLCRYKKSELLKWVITENPFCIDTLVMEGIMEIAKFIYASITTFLGICTAFAALWAAYNKKINARIIEIENNNKAAITAVQTDINKKIEAMRSTVEDMQNSLSNDLQQRLSNIEGEMKGIRTVLNTIQQWFIDNTPKGRGK